MTKQNRHKFRENCFKRDNNECVVPWCDSEAVDAHHIIERREWSNGGYFAKNGASVCSKHHKYAEKNMIPPQAFWMWLGIDNPITPDGYDVNINKWGDTFETPPWEEHRKYIKYPSSHHLPFSNMGDKNDTYIKSVERFLEKPLVITEKIDGSNASLVKDKEDPVRARNGSHAKHESFDLLKQLYWQYDVYDKLPENMQIFGEWVHAKHSIHYGCDCEEQCVDVGENISDVVNENINDERAFFQIFGVYNTKHNIWLSWPTVENIAQQLGFPTTPVIEKSKCDSPMFENRNEFYDKVYNMAQNVVKNGGEGLVVRTKFPYHYDQWKDNLGKFVRENHVKTDEHWKHTEQIYNNL